MAADTEKTRRLLQELVGTPSVFPNEKHIGELLEEKLLQRGFHVERLESAPGRDNLVAWCGEHEKYLGFYGHMDTVPPAIDYPRSPFEVHWQDNRAMGLGTADMKGGLTCILRACEIVKEEFLPVKIIFGVDEENISLGANDLSHSRLLADVVFLISAEGAQIVDQDERITSVFGRKGRSVLDVRIKGCAAHAAEPEKGKSAIREAARIIPVLEQIPFPQHPKLGRTVLLVEAIQSSVEAYSVPELCNLRVSALTSPGTTSESCKNAILDCANELEVDVEVLFPDRPTPYSEAYEIDLDDPFLKIVQQEILDPMKITAQYSGSVADENVFARELGIPILCLGAVGAGIHQASEWVDLNSMNALIQVYQKAMRLFHSHVDGAKRNDS